jgi:thioredoxin-like negative regulator of GroEL
MNSVSQVSQALDLLKTAHELSPAKQSIALQLAISLINSGKAAEAVPLLKTAYESATDNTDAKSTYVIALIAAGKEAEARQMFSDDPGIFESPQIAQAYMIAKDYGKAIAAYRAVVKANPTDMNLKLQLAQAYYGSGQISSSVATLREIEKDHPEYKDQIEASVKQIQK